ncbi:MAG: hypothetical protein CVV12_00490 [Gammaproteobacteria bacterium HGW-Gammaproteobacteria-2]|nr:MAG: hypothetical protein CVV12_00490 [Gammaproteobacteria bacterium HGW-Gammaproteobacteria-2]
MAGALLLLVVLGLALLGFWQLDRADQKQQMLDAVAQVLALRRPVAMGQVLDRTSGHFAWAVVSGHFEMPLIFLDNQHYQGRSGVRLYAPLAVPGENTRLLVDLGWLPWPAGRVLPNVQLPEGPLTLSGLLAPPPSVGLRVGEIAQVGQAPMLLTRLDPEELGAHGDVLYAARVLRLDPASPFGYARNLDVLPNTLPPERHRGYAVQWFALAAALFFLMLWQHRHKKDA